MPLWNAITLQPHDEPYLKGYAVVRPLNTGGISDVEFQVGARMYEYAYPGLVKLNRMLEEHDYEILTADAWMTKIAERFDPNTQADRPDFYKNAIVRKDKWDADITIY